MWGKKDNNQKQWYFPSDLFQLIVRRFKSGVYKSWDFFIGVVGFSCVTSLSTVNLKEYFPFDFQDASELPLQPFSLMKNLVGCLQFCLASCILSTMETCCRKWLTAAKDNLLCSGSRKEMKQMASIIRTKWHVSWAVCQMLFLLSGLWIPHNYCFLNLGTSEPYID